jgi:hypothetical protein
MRENRVSWPISAGLMLASVVVAFSCLALALEIFAELPEVIAVIGTTGILFGLFFALLSKYLTHSKHPFVHR